MPYKDQLQSFRTRKGERYLGYEDIPDGHDRVSAKVILTELRSQGARAFPEHHPDGYTRIFVHVDDYEKPYTHKEIL